MVNLSLNEVSHTLRLREYYYMLVRHKLIFTSVVTITLALSVAIAFNLPKIYRAETVLLVQDEDILNPLIRGLAITSSTGHRLRTLREELLSWERLTLLVEKLKLDKEVKNPLQFEKLIKALRQNIAVKMRGQGIITLAFEGELPREAQDIVQTLSDIIVDGSITSLKIETSNAIEFIKNQLDLTREKLEVSEKRLREFKEVYLTSLPLAIRLNESIAQAKLALSQMLVDNTEKHPRVIATKNLIERLEKQRDQQMKLAQEEGADITAEDFEKLVSSVPRQEQHLAQLTRDYDVNARLYDSFLQRLETAKLSEVLEESDKGPKFKILEPARLPLQPVKPNKPLIAFIGFILGAGLGFGVIFLMDLSDTSIRSLEEATAILEFPIFGSISPIWPDQIALEHRLRREASV